MKCQNCGTKIVKFPLRDEQGKFIWKNLFKMDMMSIIFIVCIIAMFLTYKIDLGNYQDIVSDPVKYCDETNVCKYLEEQSMWDEPLGQDINIVMGIE